MTSISAFLANGLRHALHVRQQPGRRARGMRLTLLDKASGQVLWQEDGGRRHGRLPRAATRELAMLRDRLDGHTWPGDPPGRSAWAALAAGALAGLGIAADVPRQRGLPPCPEPAWLQDHGRDLAGRPVWLVPSAGRAWLRLRQAAAADGLAFAVVSSWRSVLRQAELLRGKMAAGRSLAELLEVNALPGYSEHHLGTTIDLHAGRGPLLEEAFESTPAFAWLDAHAGRFGFRLSYPRGNPHGIAYEPWHWRWHAPAAAPEERPRS